MFVFWSQKCSLSACRASIPLLIPRNWWCVGYPSVVLTIWWNFGRHSLNTSLLIYRYRSLGAFLCLYAKGELLQGPHVGRHCNKFLFFASYADSTHIGDIGNNFGFFSLQPQWVLPRAPSNVCVTNWYRGYHQFGSTGVWATYSEYFGGPIRRYKSREAIPWYASKRLLLQLCRTGRHCNYPLCFFVSYCGLPHVGRHSNNYDLLHPTIFLRPEI